VILPNNRRILELAQANSGLLDRGDRFALAEFKVHNDAFTYNMLSGDKDENAPVFPIAMAERFEDDA
jgi:hypothetical protein